jgi:hypothetical protein
MRSLPSGHPKSLKEGLGLVGTQPQKFEMRPVWGATFPHIVPLPNIYLTGLFSKARLKRKDFQEIERLTRFNLAR